VSTSEDVQRDAGESAASIADYQKGTVEAWEEQRRKPWQVYVDATLGFRNHWYPAFYSHELREADVSDAAGEPVANVKAMTLLGEAVICRRIGGKVHAVQDWCLHRGVPFSSRPECYTRETITCWYHGFTYDLRNGDLTHVITDPGCPLIGKIRLRTYPVIEAKGLVWIFVGDMDPPPPLESDVPPGLLDDDFWVYPDGWSKVVACNWRPAAENGFDPAHAYIHRNSGLTTQYKVAFPFSETGISKTRGMEVVQSDTGPNGVKLLRGGADSVWEADVDGVKVATRYRPGEEGVFKSELPEVSMWLPSTLWVNPFPAPGVVHLEFYVPLDENTHCYMITWGTFVKSEEQRAQFEEDVRTIWSDVVPNHFSNEDVFAREALHDFYANPDGWFRERLFGPDVVITTWRNMVSRANRGVQRRGLQ
jgi:carbazole 1,9a-dioxygenase terminal dioxygenase component